jgi:hypothetical protein
MTAAQISVIAACVAAVGTFLAPLFALRVSARLEQRGERQRPQFGVFQTLMQWRATPFVVDPVRAFNSIGIVFFDARAVRDARSDLFSTYNDERLRTPEGGRIRQDKLITLLQAMARHLGYASHFMKADFERFYNPEALGQQMNIMLEQQRRTHEALFSQQQQPQLPLPQTPASPAA